MSWRIVKLRRQLQRLERCACVSLDRDDVPAKLKTKARAFIDAMPASMKKGTSEHELRKFAKKSYTDLHGLVMLTTGLTTSERRHK